METKWIDGKSVIFKTTSEPPWIDGGSGGPVFPVTEFRGKLILNTGLAGGISCNLVGGLR